MTSTSGAFPLSTLDPYTGPGSASDSGGGVDSAAGASGSSPGVVEISRGAMIAIIVVVCVVAVVGSEWFH